MRMRTLLLTIAAATLLAVSPAGAQLLQQSELTLDDVDPTWRITLDHLGADSRWMGVAPRNVAWSPDGAWVYFQWNESPERGQRAAADPWYAVDRDGDNVRMLSDAEAGRLPQGLSWSADRSLAAWSRGGTLFLWSDDEGTRSPMSLDGGIGNLRPSADGSKLHFSTSGTSWGFEGGTGDGNGDLWEYDVESGRLRIVARAQEKSEDKKTDAAEWLEDQQLELLENVVKRKEDREIGAAVRRARAAAHVQRIPIAKGVNARNLQLSPDGRFVTFQWVKDSAGQHRTQFMEFVNESGYAEMRPARPKVGEPMASFRMGIVEIDPEVHPDSVEVTWVDDDAWEDEDDDKEDGMDDVQDEGDDEDDEDNDDRDVIIHGPYYSPDGRTAVLQTLSMDHKDRWISVLDLENGDTRLIDHQHEDAWIGGPLVGGRWSPGYLQWLPDASGFAFTSTATGWAMLHLAERQDDGSFRVKQLTHGEWEVRGAELGPEGEWWYLTTSQEHPGEEHLYRLPAHGGELERLTYGEGMAAGTVSPDGDRVAVLFETKRLMRDLYLADPGPASDPRATTVARDARRITKSGTDEFYRMELLDSEIVTFDDYSGEPTWAEIWERPENPNGAAIVYVHGCGECAQAVTKGWRRVSARLYAKYVHQLGYQSANLDYRGSSGYGHANRTYAYRKLGVSDIDSGLALLDILERDYGVDRDRIGVYGGSYGGFYTLMAIFRHPDRFRAGVALYPVTDWAHYNHGYTSRLLNGAPYEDEEAYRKSSPVYYVESYERGLQIQHGLIDNNVQTQDSFRLVQMLMEKRKPFDAMIYPMQAHGWREEPTRRDSFWRMTRWFDQELLGKAAVTGHVMTETESQGGGG